MLLFDVFFFNIIGIFLGNKFDLQSDSDVAFSKYFVLFVFRRSVEIKMVIVRMTMIMMVILVRNIIMTFIMLILMIMLALI